MQSDFDQDCKAKPVNWLSLASFAAILATAGFSMVAFNDLRYLCVCISNWLAWSWIAFGTSLLLGIVQNQLIFLKPASQPRFQVIGILQIISFLAGTCLLIYFAGLLTRVW